MGGRNLFVVLVGDDQLVYFIEFCYFYINLGFKVNVYKLRFDDVLLYILVLVKKKNIFFLYIVVVVK